MQSHLINLDTHLKKSIILHSVVAGVVLNITLALLFSEFATDSQIKPPEGAAKLNFLGQFIHMLVHHKQVLFMSSVIVAIVVGVSVTFAVHYRIPFLQNISNTVGT